jgi:hypothetical protein
MDSASFGQPKTDRNTQEIKSVAPEKGEKITREVEEGVKFVGGPPRPSKEGVRRLGGKR